MDTNQNTLDSFPWPIVLFCEGVALSVVGVGLYFTVRLSLALAVLYGLYCLWVEMRVLWMSCRHCFYYGKVCGFGKGKLCSWLFDKGDPSRFAERQITWRDVAPDLVVPLAALVAGVVLLIRSFSWVTLLLLVALVLLGTIGTGTARGRFACKYCRQRETGCPAQRLFASPAQQAPTEEDRRA